MKPVLFLCFITVFVLLGAGLQKSSLTLPLKPRINQNDTIDFIKQVQPILVKNCSPCHFTGGKMYERLPFDKDTTIINHEKGILRRIKGDESTLIQAFIMQHKR